MIALLEILAEGSQRISKDWKLQIIGDGNERKNLEKFVQENQLQEQCDFLMELRPAE